MDVDLHVQHFYKNLMVGFDQNLRTSQMFLIGKTRELRNNVAKIQPFKTNMN